jgi:hypothetical protein
MPLPIHRLKLYRPTSLADFVDLSIKERMACFRPHPIKTCMAFDPFEKEIPSEFNQIFTITKRKFINILQ